MLDGIVAVRPDYLGHDDVVAVIPPVVLFPGFKVIRISREFLKRIQ